MGDGLRTVHLVTADESLFASARAAVKALSGWEFANPRTIDELLAKAPVRGDVVVLDGDLRSTNVYEGCRRLTGKTGCRTFITVERDNRLAEAIARFCGASGVLTLPLTAPELRRALETHAAPELEPRAALRAGNSTVKREPTLPDALLRDLSGAPDERLIEVLTDPETQLFNYAFLRYKLDEEFKRALRFQHPLSCVMLGFEGEASEQVLRELAGIILSASRDTDVLGRFDASSFLFLLPYTGPDGAAVMARRVEEAAASQGLRDLVGDPLQIAVGISFHPHSEVEKAEDMYARARRAFFSARQEGGGVVTSG